MRNLETIEELNEYIQKNDQYLLTSQGIDEKKQLPFLVEHDQFRKIFYDTLIEQKILKNIHNSFPRIELVIKELSKFPRTKIRNKILQAYQQLCSSLRVLNLFFEHYDFLISPFENKEELHNIFGSNQTFLALNHALANLFLNEDKRASNGLPLCRTEYQSSLKAIVSSETLNFRELTSFFQAHPLIKNFFDDNLIEIAKYANLYAEKRGIDAMRLFKPEPIKIKLKLKRKLESPDPTTPKKQIHTLTYT